MDPAFMGFTELCTLWREHPPISLDLTVAAWRWARLLFGEPFILRHRVMCHDLTLEDPHFNTTRPICGESCSFTIINVSAQCMERHTALTVPFGTGYFGTTQTASTINPHTKRAKSHG
jgi:hypothetical protein